MKKRMMRITACFLAAAMSVGGSGMTVLADGVETSLVGMSAADGTEVSTEAETAAEPSVETAAETAAETTAETAAESEETVSTGAAETSLAGVGTAEGQDVASVQAAAAEAASPYSNVGIAQCEAYINVRDAASTDGNVLGKLYNGSAVTILGREGNWYLVEAGSMTGYVCADYFATGTAAEAIANEVGGTTVGTATADGLNVRTEASSDSDIVTMVNGENALTVLEDCGDWVKVSVDDDVEGYVAKEYIETEIDISSMDKSESNEEEDARIESENQAWLDYLAEQEAERERLNQAWIEYLAAQESAAASAQAEAEAAAAQQQAEAEAAAAQAAAAQAAADQAAADAAAWDQSDAEAAAAAQAAADQAAAEAAAAQAAADQAAADAAAAQQQAEAAAAQTEAAVTETENYMASETTETASATSETSSLRTSVVNYALQFVGNPYVYGGTSLTNGTDCSGFTMSVLANFGISIPRVAASQASAGTAVDVSAVQPGDLLFYSDGSGISHVAMYIGGGQVVHASNPTNGIIISNMYYRTPVCARNFL